VIKVTVTNINARSSARQPRTVVVRVPGPQGSAGTANIGTVTVLDPDQNPTITASGTEVDRIYNYGLPRAAVLSVGNVSSGTDGLDADVTATVTNGDVALDFTLPRSNVTIGTVTPVNPDVAPDVTATTTDGDVAFNFDLPEAAAFTVNAATVVNPDQSPAVSATETDGDYALTFDLPRAPDFTVGTVTVGADATDAVVTDVGANGDIELDFTIPRATVDVGTTTPINPDQSPAVTNSGDDAAAVFDFDLPRAPTFTVGTVATTAPGTSAVISNIGTNGDIVLDFDIPKGDTGDTGAGLPPTSAADEGKIIFVTSTGSTELRIPDTDDVLEATNLYYTDARVEAVISNSDTDDLADVTVTAPASGDVLAYDGTVWRNEARPHPFFLMGA
jgi:hypothetical protein